MNKLLVFFLPAVLLLWVLSALRPLKDKAGELAVKEFGAIPLMANGRVQPLDSLARNSLLQLLEKQTVKVTPWKSGREKLTASEWLLEMFFKPELADTRPVFRIDNPDLKGLLGLPMDADESKQTDGKHFTWLQIREKLEPLQIEAQRAQRMEAAHRKPYDQALIRAYNGVGIYMSLQNAVQPQNARDWQGELLAYLTNIREGVTAARAQQEGKPHDEAALNRLLMDVQRFDAMSQMQTPLIIPPESAKHSNDDWKKMGSVLMDVARGGTPQFAIAAFARMSKAYRAGQAEDFNKALGDYRENLKSACEPEMKKARTEQHFNSIAPFYKSLVLYVIGGLCAIGYWFQPNRLDWLRRNAHWIVFLALGVHTAGLIFRMALEGRPPVTNLYSSAIFIGWGACVLGLILERFWRNSIGLVVSATIGFLTLIIAHHLSLSGDTMEMMRAVLDSNFWLATHVIVITLGYSATFVAGFLAIIYILRGVFTPSLTPSISKSLTAMVYGIICFATLFSFVGTVLGGIWADQSWGRFWGWDPKENGALIIVLWNAVILHMRWGGMIKERGLMNLSIIGNIVTAWSWFGVNMLGIGLHSYGFTDAAFLGLVGFVASQLAIVGVGLLPRKMWRSSRSERGNDAQPPKDALPA